MSRSQNETTNQQVELKYPIKLHQDALFECLKIGSYLYIDFLTKRIKEQAEASKDEPLIADIEGIRIINKFLENLMHLKKSPSQ